MPLALGTNELLQVYPKLGAICADEQSAATTRPTLPALSGLLQAVFGVDRGVAQNHPLTCRARQGR